MNIHSLQEKNRLNHAVNVVNSQLVDKLTEEIEFGVGLQNIVAKEDSLANIQGIKGKTLINLLQRQMNIVMNTGEKFNSEKIEDTHIVKGKADHESFIIYDNRRYITFKKKKYYILLTDVLIKTNTTKAKINIGLTDGFGAVNINQTKVGVWQTIGYKFEGRDATAMPIVGTCYAGGVYEEFEIEVKCPRVYEITESDYNEVSLTSEQLLQKYPYMEGMNNVINPYAINTSNNLLPPFSEWEYLKSNESIYTILDAYEVLISNNDLGSGAAMRYYVKMKGGTSYTINSNIRGDVNGGEIYAYGCDANKVRLTKQLRNTFNVSNNVEYIEVVCNTTDGVAAVKGTFIFKNPTLTPTSELQSFAPQSRSMWAAECQLAANPIDGTNPDVLHMWDDGLPFVLEKWGKIELDGSLNWEIAKTTQSGFKIAYAIDSVPNNSSAGDWDDEKRIFAIKYDGKVLSVKDGGIVDWDNGDIIRVYLSSFYISIPNSDSGWGDSYTPTKDEINAYFNGWRMFKFGDATNAPYNGEGQKDWAYRQIDGSLGGGGNTSVPINKAPINSRWQPYHLQYLKSKPTVEPVRNYETGLTLGKGWNMVEVGSGVVIREKANPYPNGDGTYSINTLSNPTKYRVDSISSVYRNNVRDVTYSLERRKPDSEYIGTLGYGFAKTSSFDSTAVYHVTYTMLDPTLSAPINGSIATNLRGVVTDVVQWASDAERRLSVVENGKGTHIEDTGWINATPLNKWTSYDVAPFQYRIRDGLLFMRGLVYGGDKSIKTIARLPIRDREKRTTWMASETWSSTDMRAITITVTSDGQVLAENAEPLWFISFDNIIVTGFWELT
ncbi:hypothetical protein M5X17_27520 [Paenibacillus alvei]|uniref:hypothetical protein n=1 Tax=Paenibacillus alvei TaxID=44250 RepID=UPI00227FF719|nr:hypothetical protein [Paenibacillus alvei]MCY9737455.1 hypothetical protein [Paenibacillus alvei]